MVGWVLPVGELVRKVSPLVAQFPVVVSVVGGCAVTRLSKSRRIWHRSMSKRRRSFY